MTVEDSEHVVGLAIIPKMTPEQQAEENDTRCILFATTQV